MLILHDAISIFISPTPNFLLDFALEQFWQNCKYLPYCRVWECPPLLKMCPRWSFMKIKWVILWPFYGCKHPLAPGLIDFNGTSACIQKTLLLLLLLLIPKRYLLHLFLLLCQEKRANIRCSLSPLHPILIPILAFNTTVEDAVLIFVNQG